MLKWSLWLENVYFPLANKLINIEVSSDFILDKHLTLMQGVRQPLRHFHLKQICKLADPKPFHKLHHTLPHANYFSALFLKAFLAQKLHRERIEERWLMCLDVDCAANVAFCCVAQLIFIEIQVDLSHIFRYQ